jgi:hypothetical protein
VNRERIRAPEPQPPMTAGNSSSLATSAPSAIIVLGVTVSVITLALAILRHLHEAGWL